MIGPGISILESGFIDSGDNYYFSHHDEAAFPAYRIVLDDAEQTRYYFDATTAELIQKYDRDRRWNRWLFLGLHRGDFTTLLRQRPLWDLFMLPLLIGVIVGTYSSVAVAAPLVWSRKAGGKSNTVDHADAVVED